MHTSSIGYERGRALTDIDKSSPPNRNLLEKPPPLRRSKYISIFLRDEPTDGRVSLQIVSTTLSIALYLSSPLNFTSNKQYHEYVSMLYATPSPPRLSLSIIIRTIEIGVKGRASMRRGLEKELPLRECNGTVTLVTEWRKWRSRASTSD